MSEPIDTEELLSLLREVQQSDLWCEFGDDLSDRIAAALSASPAEPERDQITEIRRLAGVVADSDLIEHWAECPAPPDAGCSRCKRWFAARQALLNASDGDDLDPAASPAEPEPTAFVMSEDDRFHVWSKLEAIRRETESGRFGTPGHHITLDHVYEEATTAQALVTYDANGVTASPAEPVERDEWADDVCRLLAEVRPHFPSHYGRINQWIDAALAARPVPVSAAPTDEPPTCEQCDRTITPVVVDGEVIEWLHANGVRYRHHCRPASGDKP